MAKRKTKTTSGAGREVRALSQQKTRRISRGAVKHASLDSQILPPNVVSTDFGNGFEEAWHIDDQGNVKSYAGPHGRIPVTGDLLDEGVMVSQHEVEHFEWLGASAFHNGEQIDAPSRFGYGEGAWEITARTPEQHRNDPDRYAGDQQMSKIILSLAKLGIESGSEVTLLVPVPPSLLVRGSGVAAQVRERIIAGQDGKGNGWWSIKLKGEKQWRDYFITRVGVIPEGLGAAYAYRFDINAQVVPLNYFSDRVDDMTGLFRVHDGGFGTYDIIDFHNGTLSPDSIRVATDTKGGIQEHIAKPIIAEVKRLTGVQSLTEMHVDGWLRTWAHNKFTEASAVQYVGGNELMMFNMFVKLCREYGEWVCREKIGPGWNDGVNAIAEAGGAWSFFEALVADKYDQRKILRPALYDHIRWVPTYSLNGYGALVYMATLLNKGK